MHSLLHRNRARIDLDLTRPEERTYLSPIFYTQYQTVRVLIGRYLRGRVIDLGCGTMPFRPWVEEVASTYHGLDVSAKADGVALIGDIQNLAMIVDAAYDAVLCCEVLEHVPEPSKAIQEMFRILKPGGVALITVPHLSRLHDLPHDYYRFTSIGLGYLVEKAGFKIVELQVKGGILTFLGHQLSSLLLSATWSVPGLKQVVWQLNKWVVTRGFVMLDQQIDRSGILAQGYAVVVRKPV